MMVVVFRLVLSFSLARGLPGLDIESVFWVLSSAFGIWSISLSYVGVIYHFLIDFTTTGHAAETCP